ncbi:MAG: coproporphyrinogen dehydrogenase HemZ [Firmicutes bacterium]|nr:coproporphyrinogen dehydrogenase HemZ [Bacillota bacterium]
MYRFYLNNVDNDYNYSELCRVFLNDDEFETIGIRFKEGSRVCLSDNSYLINCRGSNDANIIKLELLKLLEKLTGKTNEWGTLTGVRPLKIAKKIYDDAGSIEGMQYMLKFVYALSDDKIALLTDTLKYQLEYVKESPLGRIGIYIGIPFCPTRCSYCSFASNVAADEEIEDYLCNLLEEIRYMGELITAHNEAIESIYIGGGTPTTLSSEQLERLLTRCEDSFCVSPADIEFTVEAGRPDTITAEKFEVLKKHGVSRISINPQTMKNETLALIGRQHSSEQIVEGYRLASEYGFEIINADLIAGLQDETLDDFRDSLNKVIELGANNITVHTLSVKTGSRLKESDPEYYRRNAENVTAMLDESRRILYDNGFYPYYLYRQKHQIGSLENVGYCKADMHSLYNIRIMEEKQTIIALGAGAIGKVYYPDEDRLERVANVSNYRIYNERFEEMLSRKNNYYGG